MVKRSSNVCILEVHLPIYTISIFNESNVIAWFQGDEVSLFSDDADLVVAAVPALPGLHLPGDDLRTSLLVLSLPGHNVFLETHSAKRMAHSVKHKVTP